MTAEKKEEPDLEHHIHSLLHVATKGTKVSLMLLGALLGVGFSGISSEPPVEPGSRTPIVQMEPSVSTSDSTTDNVDYSTHDPTVDDIDGSVPVFTSSPTAAPSDGSGLQQGSASDVQPGSVQRVLDGVAQRHQENETFSEVASIIRDALGLHDVSESTAAAVLIELIKKYADKVLENLLDDAAASTSDAIENWIKEVAREFAQILSEGGRSIKVSRPSDQEIRDADRVLPPDANEPTNKVRDEVKRRFDAHPGLSLDSRTLDAIQSPAPGAAEALSGNSESAEEVAFYLRYRVTQGALSALPHDIQFDALWKIVDTPIRSSTVNELPSNTPADVQNLLKVLPAGTKMVDLQNYILIKGFPYTDTLLDALLGHNGK